MSFRRIAATAAASVMALGAVAGLSAPAHADTSWDAPKYGVNDTGWDAPK